MLRILSEVKTVEDFIHNVVPANQQVPNYHFLGCCYLFCYLYEHTAICAFDHSVQREGPSEDESQTLCV